MKPTRQVSLAIEKASAAITIAKALIAEKLPDAGQRRQIDRLLGEAESALERARADLGSARHDAETALGRL